MELTRYIDVKKYRDLLSTGTLFFPRYDVFDDKFEGSLGYVSPDRLIHQQTDRLRRITSRPQQGRTVVREFLDAFEPAFYHRFLRDFTFVSCWHQDVTESSLMWRMYARKGIMIKSDLSSLESSMGINSGSYQRPDIFWRDNGINPLDGYEILVRIDNAKYCPLGHEIQSIGTDRYFHKQDAYADEKEFRVVLQLGLGPQQRANFPFLLDNISSPLHNKRDIDDLIYQIWEDVKRSYTKHNSILTNRSCERGVRCRVNVNSLIKEVVVSPFGDNEDLDVSEIEALNHEFGVTAEIKKSVIETKSSPTTFKIPLSNGKTITFEL